MKRWLTVALLALSLYSLPACRKAEEKSPIPQITFLTLAPDTIKGNSAKDTVFLSFDCNDRC